MKQNNNNTKLPWIKHHARGGGNSNIPVSVGTPSGKLNIFARLNILLADVLYFAMISWGYFVLAVYLVFLLFMLNHIGLMIFYITAAIFAYQKILKRYKRRLTFLHRLKAKCKKNKFRYKSERGFFKSFEYSKRGVDFKVEAGNEAYFVRFLTVKRKNSSLMFWDKDTAQTVYPRQRSWVNIRFDKPCTKTVRTSETRGLGVMRVKQMDISFNDSFTTLGNKTVHKILLLEPMPRIIYKKLPEGGVTATGTGEQIGDYTVSSADDFLNNVLGG